MILRYCFRGDRDNAFKLRHCALHIVVGGFNAVGRSCTHVRMPQYPLNDHVRHPESVKIASEPTACSVPAMPLRNLRVPFKIVCGLGHESLDVTLAYLKGEDAESEEAQEHANSSSLALYA